MNSNSELLARLVPAGRSSRRRLIAIVMTLLVLALSIPIGLKVLDRSSSGATNSGSADGGYPASGPQSYGNEGAVGSDGSMAPDGQAGVDKGAPQSPDVAGGRDSGTVGAAPGASADKPTGPDLPAVTSLKLIRTAWLGIKVTDLTAASAKARLIATALGGQVTSENVVTASDPTGGYGITEDSRTGSKTDIGVPPVGINEARLGLSIPSEKLDGALTELSNIGTVSYRSSQSSDVTSTYIDTKARIQPAKDSIDRVRALLVKATTLDQIVMLESEVSRRQADLESLEQQLADLDNRTSMSEVTVTLWTAATTPTTVEADDDGFLHSLASAWDALLTSLAVIVTGLAVLLPWLLIAGIIAWVVRRWMWTRPATASTSAATPDPVPATAPTPASSSAPSAH